jgi:ketosteroid isomerase-like protein
MPAPEDDEYLINLAQSELRDGINSRELDRAMAVIAPIVTWMRDGEPSYWGGEGHRAVRFWAERMIQERAKISLVPIGVRILDDVAFATGWETLTFPAREALRSRFFQVWERSAQGQWQMSAYISNQDVAPRMLGS